MRGKPEHSRRLRQRISLAGGLLILLAAAALAAFPWYVHLFIFRPAPLEALSPEQWGVAGARTVSFRAADGSVLVGWWAEPEPQQPVALVLHGRSGNISGRAGVAARLARDGYGVLLFDYRGYGRSTGAPSEEALFEDAAAAYEWVRARGLCAGRIVVIGQSLDNAPAAHLAAARPVAGLVLVSPFLSLPEAAADRLPWLPLGFLGWPHNRFEVAAHLRQLRAPLVLVAGGEDRLVSILHSRKGHAVATVPTQWIEEARSAHDGLLQTVAANGHLSSALRWISAQRPREPCGFGPENLADAG